VSFVLWPVWSGVVDFTVFLTIVRFVRRKAKKLDYVVAAVAFVIIAGLIILFLWQWPIIKSIFTNPHELKTYVNSFGPWAPMVFVAIYSVMVIVAVVPATFMNFISGALFGFWQGIFLSWASTVLGAFIAIILGRKVAHSVMRIVLPPQKLKKFHDYIRNHGWAYLFLLYLIPNPLGDTVNYIAALSRIRLYILVSLVAIGRLPALILRTSIGAQIHKFTWIHWAGLALIYLTIVVVVYIFRKDIDKFTLRFSKFLYPEHPSSNRK